MSVHVNRRSLMGAALVAPVAMATVAPAGSSCVAEGQTPVAALFREWQAAKIAEEAAFAASGDDAEGQQEWAARVALEKRLMEAPATSATDWAMKITAWCNFGESASQTEKENPQLWAEARQLVGVM